MNKRMQDIHNRANKMKLLKRTFFLAGAMLFFTAMQSVFAQNNKVIRDTTFLFPCNQARSIDLFKAMDIHISSANGYWGDEDAVPFPNGSIFDIPVWANTDRDTTIKFYFYITSPADYCGLSSGDQLLLNLRLITSGCEKPDGILFNYWFCMESDVEAKTQIKLNPMDIQQLLFTTATNPNKWMVDSIAGPSRGWDKVEVYRTETSTDILLPDPWQFNSNVQGADTVWVVVIKSGSGTRLPRERVIINTYGKSTLTVSYSPDIKQLGVEYDVDDDITISVDDQSLFHIYDYYLNNKHLNKYFLGGSNTEGSVTLNALTFTGADDLIKVTAVDTNNCISTFTDNVIVNVPMPNVFTPDGDGVNDVFLGGEKFGNREFHLEILNRWGNRLYFGENGWDGTYRGAEVAPGTYFYVIMLKAPDGTSRTVKGTVTLIRKRM